MTGLAEAIDDGEFTAFSAFLGAFAQGKPRWSRDARKI
jgi:hypothetical protein